MKLSVVIPIYNDQEVLDELYKRLIPALESITSDFEVILVDDGSGDSSYFKMKELNKKDQRISLIKLARNFGQQNSIAAGLANTNGEIVVLMDSDLQDRPEDISLLINEMNSHDADMAIAKWITREDSFLKKAVSNIFFQFSRYATGIKYEKGLGVFRVIRKEVIDQIINIPETTGTILSLMYWGGVNYVAVPLKRDSRFAGKSGYNLKKMLKLTSDRVFSYSLLPIRLASRVGLLLALISFVWGGIILFRHWFGGPVAAGYTSMMVVFLLLFGMCFIFLGVIGEYLGRIYLESKNRPKYIISRIVKSNK